MYSHDTPKKQNTDDLRKSCTTYFWTGSKDLVNNNFPKSGLLRDGPIVPAREVVVKDDLHGFQEILRALFSGKVDTLQNVYRDL
jgi:hypothetical protein